MGDAEVKQLPDGCGYTGRDFGAPYIDSQCFGGRLYDLDNCDEPGTLNEPPVYKSCPGCRHDEWLAGVLESCKEDGWIAAEDGLPREFPRKAEQLRYPEDYEQMKLAWLDGYRENVQENAPCEQQA